MAVFTGNGSSASPSFTFSSDTDTGIYRLAADQLGFAVGGDSAARIDASGRLVIGGNQARTITGVAPWLQIEGQNFNAGSLSLLVNESSAASGAYLVMARTRSTTAGGLTAVQNGDVLGQVRLAGSDGANYIVGGVMDARAGADWSATEHSTYLNFTTTGPTDATPVLRMRIQPTGGLVLGSGVPTTNENVNLFQIAEIGGNAIAYGTILQGRIQPEVTTQARLYNSVLQTADNGGTPYTIPSVYHFLIGEGNVEADSTITNQFGFTVSGSFSSGTENYAFYGNIPEQDGSWTFFATGASAPSFLGSGLYVTGGFATVALPTVSNVTATATATSLFQGGIRVGNPAANIDLQLPTGTDCDAYFSQLPNNFGSEWSVINAAAATYTITVTANTDHTVYGNMTVDPNTSAKFISRKGGTNSFITYRVA